MHSLTEISGDVADLSQLVWLDLGTLTHFDTHQLGIFLDGFAFTQFESFGVGGDMAERG